MITKKIFSISVILLASTSFFVNQALWASRVNIWNTVTQAVANSAATNECVTTDEYAFYEGQNFKSFNEFFDSDLDVSREFLTDTFLRIYNPGIAWATATLSNATLPPFEYVSNWRPWEDKFSVSWLRSVYTYSQKETWRTYFVAPSPNNNRTQVALQIWHHLYWRWVSDRKWRPNGKNYRFNYAKGWIAWGQFNILQTEEERSPKSYWNTDHNLKCQNFYVAKCGDWIIDNPNKAWGSQTNWKDWINLWNRFKTRFSTTWIAETCEVRNWTTYILDSNGQEVQAPAGTTCNSSCKVQTPPPIVCGNNIIEWNEACEEGADGIFWTADDIWRDWNPLPNWQVCNIRCEIESEDPLCTDLQRWANSVSFNFSEDPYIDPGTSLQAICIWENANQAQIQIWTVQELVLWSSPFRWFNIPLYANPLIARENPYSSTCTVSNNGNNPNTWPNCRGNVYLRYCEDNPNTITASTTTAWWTTRFTCNNANIINTDNITIRVTLPNGTQQSIAWTFIEINNAPAWNYGVECLTRDWYNGQLHPSWQTRPLKFPNGTFCEEDFTLTENIVCGNGTVEAWEQCDDGNETNWDGCDMDCKRETPTCTFTQPTSDQFLLSTPVNFAANTQLPRARFTRMDFGDGTINNNPPTQLVLSHTYNNIWSYTYVATVTNTLAPANLNKTAICQWNLRIANPSCGLETKNLENQQSYVAFSDAQWRYDEFNVINTLVGMSQFVDKVELIAYSSLPWQAPIVLDTRTNVNVDQITFWPFSVQSVLNRFGQTRNNLHWNPMRFGVKWYRLVNWVYQEVLQDLVWNDCNADIDVVPQCDQWWLTINGQTSLNLPVSQANSPLNVQCGGYYANRATLMFNATQAAEQINNDTNHLRVFHQFARNQPFGLQPNTSYNVQCQLKSSLTNSQRSRLPQRLKDLATCNATVNVGAPAQCTNITVRRQNWSTDPATFQPWDSLIVQCNNTNNLSNPLYIKRQGIQQGNITAWPGGAWVLPNIVEWTYTVWCYDGQNTTDPITPSCATTFTVETPVCSTFPSITNEETFYNTWDQISFVCQTSNTDNVRFEVCNGNSPSGCVNPIPTRTTTQTANANGINTRNTTIPASLPFGSFKMVCKDADSGEILNVADTNPAAQCSKWFQVRDDPSCLALEPSRAYLSYDAPYNTFDLVLELGGNISYLDQYKIYLDQDPTNPIRVWTITNSNQTTITIPNFSVPNDLANGRDLIANQSTFVIKVDITDANWQVIPDIQESCTANVVVVPECIDFDIDPIRIPQWSTVSPTFSCSGRYSNSAYIYDTSFNGFPFTEQSVASTNPSTSLLTSWIYTNPLFVNPAELWALPLGDYMLGCQLRSSFIDYTTDFDNLEPELQALSYCAPTPIQIVEPADVMITKLQRNVTNNTPANNIYTWADIYATSWDLVSYQLVIVNEWGFDAEDIVVTDTFPSTYTPTSQTSTCTNVTFNNDFANAQRTIPVLGANPPANTCTITINWFINQDYPDLVNIDQTYRHINTWSVTYDGQTRDDTVVAIPTPPILTIQKDFLQNEIQVWGTGSYQLVVTNTSTWFAYNTVLIDDMPYWLSGTSSIPPRNDVLYSPDGTQDIIRNLWTLAPGQTITGTVQFDVLLDDNLANTVITNTWSVRSTRFGPVIDTDTIPIRPRDLWNIDIIKRQRNLTLCATVQSACTFTWADILIRDWDVLEYQMSYVNSSQVTIDSYRLFDDIQHENGFLVNGGLGGYAVLWHPLTLDDKWTPLDPSDDLLDPIRNGTNLAAWATWVVLYSWTADYVWASSIRNTITVRRENLEDTDTVIAYFPELSILKEQKNITPWNVDPVTSVNDWFTENTIIVHTWDTVVYRLTYRNNSPVVYNNAILVDILPAWFIPTTIWWGWVYNALLHEITRNLWTLGAWQQWVLEFRGTIANGSLGTYTNTWEIRTDIITVRDTTLAVSTPTIRFTKQQRNATQSWLFTASDITVADGDIVWYQLYYRNTTPWIIANVAVTDVFPIGFTPLERYDERNFIWWTDFGQVDPVWWDSPFTRTRLVGTLPSGADWYIYITWRIDSRNNAITTFTNTGTVCFSTSTINGICQTDDVTAEMPAFEIRKEASPINAQAWDTITFRIKYRNISDKKLFEYTVEDLLPPTLQYVPNSTKRSYIGTDWQVIAQGNLPDVWWAWQFVRSCNEWNARLNWTHPDLCPMAVWANIWQISFDAILQ